MEGIGEGLRTKDTIESGENFSICVTRKISFICSGETSFATSMMASFSPKIPVDVIE